MSNFNLLEILRSWWLLPLALSILGFFLSLWIIVPAPTWTLLPFGVVAPEISPWLIVVNAIALALAIPLNKGWWSNIIIVCSLIGLLLSFLPIAQFSGANKSFKGEMERVLGADYLDKIPQAVQEKMRPKPLVIADIFRGIFIPEIRINRGIIFASPDGV
ncbi:MAG: hypothetical protein ACFCAD_16160 [Pleurocapsa sp.]